MKNINKYILIIVILLASLFISGCSVWENFTTYFNVYYNTSRLFTEAEEEVLALKTNLFSIEDAPISSGANQKLIKVIEKASRILQFHKKSSFVDDALLILGKAFFYQGNYQKGLRKFQELLAMQENTDLILETKLWIAKCHRRLKENERFLTVLSEVRMQAKEEDDDEILAEAYIQEVKYYLSLEDNINAIEVITEFLSVSDNNELNAEAFYQLGLLYFEEDDIENAIKSFESVSHYSPTYEIEYMAKLELAKSLRENEQEEQALKVFNSMRNEDKYSDFYAEIDLHKALTMSRLERYEDAVSLLHDVDTSYATTPSAGIARYHLGKIFEENYYNYDSALAYFSKTIGGQLPREIIVESNQKVSRFKKYFYLRTLIDENKEKLYYIENPEEFIKDSLAFVDSLSEVLEEKEIAQIQSEMQSQLENQFNPDTTGVEEDEDGGEEGEEFAGQDKRDEGNEKGRGRGRGELDLGQRRITGENVINQLPADAKPPVRPTISEDSVKTLLVKNYYDLGNLFFTEIKVLDSALYYYSLILDEFPETEYKARTLFSLGSYYEFIGEEKKADSLFNYIYSNFQAEQIVNAAASKLDKPLIDLEYDPAKELYLDAEKELLSENYNLSANKFYEIYTEYPSSPFAPQALYASGWILENELLLLDSAAVIYDTIIVKYPQSAFTSKVRPKISFYKQEKERIRQANEDSLRAVEQQRLDSLARDTTGTMDMIYEAVEDSVEAETGSEIEDIEDREIEEKSIITDTDENPEKDSLLLQHEKSIDSLRRGDDRRSIDTLQQELNKDIDSLNPGAPVPPPGGDK